MIMRSFILTTAVLSGLAAAGVTNAGTIQIAATSAAVPAPDGFEYVTIWAPRLSDGGKLTYHATFRATDGQFRNDVYQGTAGAVAHLSQLPPELLSDEPPLAGRASLINVNSRGQALLIVKDNTSLPVEAVLRLDPPATPGSVAHVSTLFRLPYTTGSDGSAIDAAFMNEIPGFNDLGETTFLARIDNRSVLLASDGLSTRTVFRQFDSTSRMNIQIGSIDSTTDINNSGEVSARGLARGPGVVPENNEFIFRSYEGENVVIARESDVSPDGNGAIDRFIKNTNVGFTTLAGNGDVVVEARFRGSVGGVNDDAAILRGDGQRLEVSIREGWISPRGEGEIGEDFTVPSVNARGELVVSADLLSSGQSVRGLFKVDEAGEISELLREGDRLPDGDGVFDKVRFAAINDRGDIAFSTQIEGLEDATSTEAGIFFIRSGGGFDDIEIVARHGTIIDGQPVTQLSFAHSFGTQEVSGLGENGDIAFQYTAGDQGIALWSSSTSIPEPAAVGISITASLLLLRWRRTGQGTSRQTA